MRTPMTLVAATLLTATVSASVLGQQVTGGRRVEVVWATRGPSESPFRGVNGIIGAPDGAIFMVDDQAQSIYRFEPETGKYTWFDRRGQGPGELRSPYLVTLTETGDVAVYDMGRRMILVYSPDLEPLRQVTLRRFITNPKGFAFLRDGSFIITGSFPSASRVGEDIYGVHRFDGRDGRRIGQYVKLPHLDNPDHRRSLSQIAGGPVFRLEDGGFLYSNSAPHRILRFDGSFGEHEIAADPEVIASAVETFATGYFNEDRQRMAWRLDWFHDQARGIFQLSDGRLLNIITRRTRGSSTWELWNPSGRPLERFEVDEPWHPYGITPDEDVLVAYDDPQTGENVVAALRWK